MAQQHRAAHADRFEKFGHARAGDRRDAEERQTERGRTLREPDDPSGCFIVHGVHLVGRDQLRFGRQRRLKQPQLLSDCVEVVNGIAARGPRDVHHMDEHLGALEVTEELMAKAKTAMSALD